MGDPLHGRGVAEQLCSRLLSCVIYKEPGVEEFLG